MTLVREGLPYPAEVEGTFAFGSGHYGLWQTDEFVLLWHHPKCRAWARVSFAADNTGHRITNMEPLTIEGSLLCPMGCGTHGFIRDGRWVAA